MHCARWAYSSGKPSRDGYGMVLDRYCRTLSGSEPSSGVSNRPETSDFRWILTEDIQQVLLLFTRNTFYCQVTKKARVPRATLNIYSVVYNVNDWKIMLYCHVTVQRNLLRGLASEAMDKDNRILWDRRAVWDGSAEMVTYDTMIRRWHNSLWHISYHSPAAMPKFHTVSSCYWNCYYLLHCVSKKFPTLNAVT